MDFGHLVVGGGLLLILDSYFPIQGLSILLDVKFSVLVDGDPNGTAVRYLL